ncbi:MAG: thioredoxin family protein [Janthinobacterium lividum]
MPTSPPPSPPPAVLLLLLPRGATGGPRQAMLDELRHRLGAAIQVLVVDEENDPDVVRSFRVTRLPSFLLLRQGIELWRQPGLPEGELIVEQLFDRLRLATSD